MSLIKLKQVYKYKQLKAWKENKIMQQTTHDTKVNANNGGGYLIAGVVALIVGLFAFGPILYPLAIWLGYQAGTKGGEAAKKTGRDGLYYIGALGYGVAMLGLIGTVRLLAYVPNFLFSK